MSKIVKVKVQLSEILGGRTHYTYPPEYDAKKIDVLAYGGAEDVPDKSHEFCIGVVSDKDAPQFLESADIGEVSVEEANTFGRKYRPQRTRVDDEPKVIELLSKQARGIELTAKERGALDPDDPTPGLTKTKEFDVRDHLE